MLVDYFDNSKLNCAEKYTIYEAVAKTSEYLSPEVVAIAEQAT